MRREGAIERIARVLGTLSQECAWRVEVHEHKPTRTGQQNRYLWSIYDQILREGGEAMGGWVKEDLHEFFLLTHFGSETRELFGKKRLIPLRRSSRLNKQEFSDLVETIMRFMAERGVYIQSPEELAA